MKVKLPIVIMYVIKIKGKISKLIVSLKGE